mgnify:CR=1 FL=1
MAVKRFEDLIVWQKAQELAITTYKEFRDCNDFGLGTRLGERRFQYPTILQKGLKEAQMQNFPNLCFIPSVQIVKFGQ